MELAAIVLSLAAVGGNPDWQPATAQDWAVRHTARFQAANDGWSGDRYPSTNTNVPSNGRQFDQRGATIGVEPIRTAQAPPPLFDRAAPAAANSGTELRSAVESGIKQANESWPAPPPLASSTESAPAATATNRSTTAIAWSAIRPELAPPRLPTPAKSNSSRLASNPALGRDSGPAFPPLGAGNSPALTSQASTEPDWSTGWGAASEPNSSARDDDASVDLVPVPPPLRASATTPRPAASPAPTTSNGADLWANFGSQPGTLPDRPQADRYATQPQEPLAASAPGLPVNQPSVSNQATIGTAPPASQMQSPAQGAEEIPWKPLLAVSLALAGSLGANLFLGWSYADARHRYRALVEKTTHSFQKAAGLAA